MTMRVIALFRVSTEKQANEGASLDAQQRTYRELAARNGWETVAEFRGCESATMAASDRHVLQSVLTCVRENNPDAIYVHEQSRLTRGDELDMALLMRELKERRIKIAVGPVIRDLSSIDERFMVGIQGLVDRAESERIKERLMRGRREKASRGLKTCGGAPYGYENPPPGQPGRGTLRVVPGEAVIVRRIFDAAARGDGVRKIGRMLKAQGVPAARGGEWCKTSLTKLLRNPAYIGVSACGVWSAPKSSRTFKFNLNAPGAIVVENAHEAIVAREVWDAVHGRVRVPRTHVPRLLSGLISVNGVAFGGDMSDGIAFYRGPKGVRGLAWLDAAATDDAVWSAFVSLATGPEFVAALMQRAQSPDRAELLHHEIDFAREQFGKLQRRRERLIDMRAEGEIEKAVFIMKSDEVNKAIETTQRQLAEYTARAAVGDATQAPRIVRAVQTLLAGRTKLTLDQKRSVLRSIVRRIDVEASKTGNPIRRDERGRVLAGRVAAWVIQSVSFGLTLPASADATEANVVDVGQSGNSDTTSGICAQPTATDLGEKADLRRGQLGTTS